MKKTLLAVAVALAAVNAQASVHGSATGPSDVVLTIWDQTAKESYSLDLGISQADILANGFTSASFASSTVFQAFVTGEKNASTDVIVYSVNSADNNTSDAYYGLAVTQAQTNVATAITNLQTKINSDTASSNAAQKLDSFFSFVGTGENVAKINNGGTGNDALGVSGQTWFAANNASATLQTQFGGLSTTTSDIVKANLSANYFYEAYSDTLNASVAQYAGSWGLDLANGSLTFTPAATLVTPVNAAPSSVPVPGAAWMMLTGLVGLVAAKRRK